MKPRTQSTAESSEYSWSAVVTCTPKAVCEVLRYDRDLAKLLGLLELLLDVPCDWAWLLLAQDEQEAEGVLEEGAMLLGCLFSLSSGKEAIPDLIDLEPDGGTVG